MSTRRGFGARAEVCSFIYVSSWRRVCRQGYLSCVEFCTGHDHLPGFLDRTCVSRHRFRKCAPFRRRLQDSFLHGGPGPDLFEPAGQVRQVIEWHAGPFPGAHPGPVRDVRDRVISGQEFVACEPLVEHPEQPLDLAVVAVDGRLDFLGKIAIEDVRLSHHRPDAGHLEHEPLQHQRSTLAVRGQQSSGLFGQVHEDRPGFEDGEVACPVIDDGRDPAVWTDRQEPGLLLLARRKIQRRAARRAARVPRALSRSCAHWASRP